MNAYEAKLEAKRARLERASDRATEASTTAYNASRAATEGIPFGQPILVGHHSEGRHRSALRKSDNAMRRACEATDRAKELARRADAVGTGGISSDDPDAIAKLADKRTDLEIRRDQMKQANAYYKTHGTLDGCDLPANVIEDGKLTLRFQGYYQRPFPPYAISGIGARIRDAAKRAEMITHNAAMPASEEDVNGATITADPDDNRVLLAFPARLSKEHYQLVRRYGFVWSPSRSAFVRKLSGGALAYARQVATLITTAEVPAP